MATLDVDKNGLKRVRFKTLDGRRESIRLGRLPKKDAETVRNYVSRLETAQQLGTSPDADTLQWLGRLTDWLYSKLVHVGLAAEKQSATLGAFLAGYVAKRVDVKGSTATVYGHTRRCLVGFFGEARPLRDISAGDADDWRRWLASDQKLADNTIRRRCGIAKQFFRAAVRSRLIQENPFGDLKGCTVRENRKRDYFVTREETAKVIGACPDAQWRLLFALSRFGGLRCPSEHLALRWGDVAWDQNRFTVHASKTEAHEDGGVRQVPIFAELRPYLEEVFEQAEPGTEWVITRYRDHTQNLRTQLQKIIQRAGLTAWLKLWQNLRSTRATELVSKGWPEYKVCKWLGHTKLVAEKHYWQVTDDDYEKAAAPSPQEAVQPDESRGPRMDQLAHVRGRKGSQPETQNPGFAGVCEGMRYCTSVQVGDGGLEPSTSTV